MKEILVAILIFLIALVAVAEEPADTVEARQLHEIVVQATIPESAL